MDWKKTLRTDIEILHDMVKPSAFRQMVFVKGKMGSDPILHLLNIK